MVLKRVCPFTSWFAVWEWCKNVWYWNELESEVMGGVVWEWCKNVWYWNFIVSIGKMACVWEWCKNVWYWNKREKRSVDSCVWEWCKNVWYWNSMTQQKPSRPFENDVKTYGTEILQPIQYVPACLRMMWKCMVLKHRFDSYSIHWCLKMM